MRPDADGRVAVAVVNRRLPGGLGVYLRYDAAQPADYVAWRMMREGLYAIGLEPATTPFGTTQELLDAGHRLMLAPGERRSYELEFGILAGPEAIAAFAAGLPGRPREQHTTPSSRPPSARSRPAWPGPARRGSA